MMEVTGVAGVLVAFKRIRRERSHLRPTADCLSCDKCSNVQVIVFCCFYKCVCVCFI